MLARDAPKPKKLNTSRVSNQKEADESPFVGTAEIQRCGLKQESGEQVIEPESIVTPREKTEL